ncbi:transposon tf2-6 polyprotein [Plakobranchus ocellatus]|uniref:Transposon tf2-6 polyprotein n=1 Tax=Plakobranchus ocellatus TaxID=259542 RepID=A0AAV3YAY6_9GAST|nr:transposon tf2-6 polyprotein [Plakobranchus ocellatus]
MEFDPLIFPYGSEDIEMPSEMSPSMNAEDEIATTAYVSTVTEDSIAEFGSSIPTPSSSHDETLRVNINPCLDSAKVQQVQELLTEFQDILTSPPGLTTTIHHVIRVSTNEIIRIKPYPLPFVSQEFLKTEISQLLSLGVIEHSTSPYCSPVVIVKKKDGSLHLCIDLRKLNSVTIFDTPLTNLLRKGSPEKVSWNQSCQQSFDTIKDLLSSDPILIIPDINEQFVVRSDASDTGLGAVLLQERNQHLMPCRYASRRLSPRECNYSVIERECLAIIFAVRQAPLCYKLTINPCLFSRLVLLKTLV